MLCQDYKVNAGHQLRTYEPDVFFIQLLLVKSNNWLSFTGAQFQIFGCLFYAYFVLVRLCVPVFRPETNQPFTKRSMVLAVFNSILPGIPRQTFHNLVSASIKLPHLHLSRQSQWIENGSLVFSSVWSSLNGPLLMCVCCRNHAPPVVFLCFPALLAQPLCRAAAVRRQDVL